MMKVVFEAKGSVAAYRVGMKWHLLFPCDADHMAKLSVNNGRQQILYTAGTDVNIELIAASDVATPTYVDEGAFLNLSDLHGSTSGVSNLQKKRETGSKMNAVELVLPAGNLSSVPPPAENYWICDFSSGQCSNTRYGLTIAAQFVIEFATNSDVKFNGVSYANTPGSTLHFFVDNYCNIAGKSDFLHYYEFFADRTDGGGKRKRFRGGKGTEMSLTDSIPKGETENTYVAFKTDLGLKYMFFGLDGDCDPVIIEPPV